MKYIYIIILLAISSLSVASDKVVEIDPNEIQLNGYIHSSLPDEMLARIKSTTETFEIVDGISFEQAVDLYKRDLDPESNLVIWEEMARVYNLYCNSRCLTPAERMDVYRALLLRSMFPSNEALIRSQPKSISLEDVAAIISQYQLEAKPIDVVKQ